MNAKETTGEFFWVDGTKNGDEGVVQMWDYGEPR